MEQLNESSDPTYSTVVSRDQRAPRPPPPLPYRQHRSADSSPSAHRASDHGADTSQLRVQYLENMLAKEVKEKTAMEQDFSKQRKKFMNQMMIIEDQLDKSRETIEGYSRQIEELKMAVREREDKLRRLSSKVGSSVIQAYDSDRLKLEEEIDYLKKHLQMAAHENRVELERVKAEWTHEKQILEREKTEALKEKYNLQHQLKSLKKRHHDDGGERERKKSPIPPPGGRKSPVPPQGGRKSPLPKEVNLLAPGGEDVSVINFQSESSLEKSMIRAAEDAKLLQSVVVPLEKEIELLKMKLKEANDRLEQYEGKGESDTLEAPLIEFSLPSISPSRSPVPPRKMTTPTDISETELLEKLLSQERTARHDLEMHIEGLRRQKTMLLGDVERLKEELAHAKDQLKKEEDDHKTLRSTWERANISFLSANEDLRQQIVKLKAQHDGGLVQSVDVSPSLPEAHTGAQTEVSGTDAHARRHKRSRSISWSEGVTGNESSQEGESVWKSVVEQLQKLLKELRSELSLREASCIEYEQQLERVQVEMSNEIDHKTTEALQMRAEVSKVQAALIRERKGREDLRKALIAEKEEMKTRIEQFQSQEGKMRQKLKVAKDKFSETKHEVQKDMVLFSDERIKLHTLVDQVKEENEMLKVVQASEIMEYRNKLDKMEAARRESEFNVASTFEELTKLRAKEGTMESKLSLEITNLQHILARSRQERTKLSEELATAQEDIGELQRRTSVLDRERNEAIQSRSSIQEKSKAFIEDQQQQIIKLSSENEQYKEKMTHLHTQISVLKDQLKNSESVQKDFVELSQSLQVRLVELEETESARQDSVNSNDSSHVT